MGRFIHCSVCSVFFMFLLLFDPSIHAVIVQNWESNTCRGRIIVMTFGFIVSAIVVPYAKSIVSSKIAVSTCLLVILISRSICVCVWEIHRSFENENFHGLSMMGFSWFCLGWRGNPHMHNKAVSMAPVVEGEMKR